MPFAILQASVPPEELRGRFGQYRKLSQEQLEKLQEQLDVTIKKTTKKVNTLKAQFQEHKSKWESVSCNTFSCMFTVCHEHKIKFPVFSSPTTDIQYTAGEKVAGVTDRTSKQITRCC